MRNIFAFLSLWGMLDALWLAADAPAWSMFWRRGLRKVGSLRSASLLLAAFQFGCCAWLLGQNICKRK